jgi:hypothetical protein
MFHAAPAAREKVQAGQPVGQVCGIVVGGVLGGHQSDVGGHCGKGCERRLRVGPSGDVELVDLAQVFAEPQPFAQEESREEAAFCGLCHPAGKIRSQSGIRSLDHARLWCG